MKALAVGGAMIDTIAIIASDRIEQMTMPLGIVATDLDSGQGIVFRVGDPGVAVRASSAVPAVFQPVRIGSREYVDGGLVSPVPVRFARRMGADLVIAIDITAVPDGNPTGDPMRMLLQTFPIMKALRGRNAAFTKAQRPANP